MKSKKRRRPRAQLPVDDGTVSGLDESQIDAGDLDRLRQACRLARLLPVDKAGAGRDRASIDVGFINPSCRSVELRISEPVSQRIRVAPLPRRSRIHRAVLPVGMIQVRHGLQQALRQPIRRHKLGLGELKAAQEKELYRQLFVKYGERAQKMTVRAVFAHIPPEAAKSARLSADLASLEFCFPENTSPRSAVGGYYLIVLRNERNRTWSVLFRL